MERRALRALLIGCVVGATSVAAGGMPAVAHGSLPPVTPTVSPSCPKPPADVQRVAPGNGKTVALTFDDGPGGSTQQLIDVLQQQHVTATFFNLGQNETVQPDVVRAEARDGFALGDHTWDHKDLTTLDADQQAREIDRERALQTKLTGHESCLFRPPYGSQDTTTTALTQQRHMAIWDWSVDTEDWKANGSSDEYWIRRITRRADAGVSQPHPVILMHNQPAGNPATVAALSRIIRFYRAHDYTFVDVLGDTGKPYVSGLGTTAGPTAGGQRVVIHGGNFRNVTAVRFGRQAAADLTVKSMNTIVATSPARHGGSVYVRVESGDHGDSIGVAAARYRYVPPPVITEVHPAQGPTTGGQKVRISGRAFVDVIRVRIGRVSITPNHVFGGTRIWLTMPPHRAGTFHLVVRTRYGVTTPSARDQYTYVHA